ncbi:MAG: hypothetical protein DELT_00531 [Desulfovibrio sp.]
MTIGQKIRQIRGKISREDFAKSIGIHAQTLYRYEKGERGVDSDVIAAICKAYNISTNWIIFGEEGNETDKAEPVLYESNLTDSQKGCKQCLALYAKLDTANERLYKTMQENSDLKEEVGKLKTELAILKNKRISTTADSEESMASAS